MITQSSLVNRVTSSGQSGAVDYQPVIKDEPHSETLPSETVYLHLELVDDNNFDDISSSNNRIIKQGKSYNMVVYASDTRNHAIAQTKLKISSSIELLLECIVEENTYSTVTIVNPYRIMTYEEIKLKEDVLSHDGYVPFHLTIPNDCPKGFVSFRLSFRTIHAKFKLQYRLTTNLELKIDGPYNAEFKKLQNKCYIDVNEPLPDCTAILYVTEVNSNKLQMICAYRDKFLHIDSTNWIPTRLADFVEQAKSLQKSNKEIVEEIQKTLRDFSTQGPEELITWLRELLLKSGEQQNQEEHINLIISDDTDYEIPWEAFEIDDEVYLGAEARVVRWSKVQLFSMHKLLAVQNVKYEGSVIAFLNDKELGEQQTYIERKTLEGLQVTPSKLIRDLVDYISAIGSLKGVGLIYLGCHGNNGVVLGSDLSNNLDRVTYVDLQNPINHPDPRPIVFVNACDSARLKQSNGLRRVFLARFASGYIGTLGRVVSTYASKVAGCILESALMEKDGIQIAETLRQLRAEAVGMVARRKSSERKVNIPGIIAQHEQRELTEEEKNLYFLHTFMYVYYGNPLSRLRLTRKQVGEGRGI
jgi:hypothetical protein